MKKLAIALALGLATLAAVIAAPGGSATTQAQEEELGNTFLVSPSVCLALRQDAAVACLEGFTPGKFADPGTRASWTTGVFDTNFDGNFNNDLLGGGPGTGTFVGSFDPGVGLLTDPVCVDGQCIVNGALGPASVPVPQGYFSGRISWREIVRN